MGANLCPARAAPKALSAAVVRRVWLCRQLSALPRLLLLLGTCSLAHDIKPCTQHTKKHMPSRTQRLQRQTSAQCLVQI